MLAMARATGITPLSKDEKNLIDRIRSVRQEKERTQEDLSVEIGMNANYLGLVETYRRGLSLKALFKLAKVLGVKPVKFFE